jgi:GNAT superfamily N-acetyltransferase
MQHRSLELAKLIHDAIGHKQGATDKQLSARDIAAHLRISDQRFSTYANGSRIPRRDFAGTLARYFFKSERERAEFVAALDRIRAGVPAVPRQPAPRSSIEGLVRGESLRVSKAELEPFAGRSDDFFDQVFDRFFRLTGLTIAQIQQPGLNITDALRDNVADVYVSCIASVSNSLLANFWTTPIRLGLGAVIHGRYQREKERVRRVLTLQEHKPRYLKPIVIRGEPGYTYCRERLHCDEADLVCLEDRKPAVLAEALRRLSVGSQPIPVVVIDEFTSFTLLRELGNEGLPVIALSTRENNRTDPACRELPQYFLGFACARRQEELRAMIDQAFSLFLSTETNTTADALAALYENLVRYLLPSGGNSKSVLDYYWDRPAEGHPGETEALRFRLARSWALYALTLDRISLTEYPATGQWKAILQQAREIVQESVALDSEEIGNQISLCSGYPKQPRPLSYSEFRELCAVFDLQEPHLTYAQQHYILEDQDMVVAAIRSALRGRPLPSLAPPALRVEVFSPLTQEVAGVVSGFLGEAARLYIRELGENNATTSRLREFMDPDYGDPAKQYKMLSQEFSGVVLASHGKHERHYVGCACLRPLRSVSGEIVEGYLEVCYLFVLEPFRGLKIAQYLLYEAHATAKAQGYSTLVYWMLPQYFAGIRYLEKRGFQWRKDRLGHEGRSVLQYQTAVPFPCPAV